MFNIFSLDSFSMFSFEHLVILSVFTIIIISVAIIGFYSVNNSRLILLISKILIGFTVFQEICDYLNRYFNGTLSWSIDLPLHICNYVLFLSIIAIYNRSEYIFNFCYFNAFSGALMANLTPDTEGVVGDWGLFFFFLHHFLIIINVVWMIFAFNMKPTFKGAFITTLMLNIFAIPIGLINVLIGDGSNYMYLYSKPPIENILLIGEWPIYIFALEIIGLAIFIILLTPFKIRELLR